MLMVAYSAMGQIQQAESISEEVTDAIIAIPVVTTPINNEDDADELSFEELEKDIEIGIEALSPTHLVPAHDLYKIWHTNMVNPYGIRLVDKPDTTIIDLSGYVHPINNVVTSEFGFRRGFRHHYGIDLRLNRGDSVLSAFDGMVRVVKFDRGGYGHYTVVRHHNGLETVYGHFSKVVVEPNQEVKAGDLLGFGGSTGRSSGPHLHYEIRYLGVPINPRKVICFNSFSTKSDTLFLYAGHFNYIKEIEQIRFWTVRKGDTLGRISQRTGVSINRLCQLNGIRRNSILRIGQRIRYT